MYLCGLCPVSIGNVQGQSWRVISFLEYHKAINSYFRQQDNQTKYHPHTTLSNNSGQFPGFYLFVIAEIEVASVYVDHVVRELFPARDSSRDGFQGMIFSLDWHNYSIFGQQSGVDQSDVATTVQ
jgi:hypothetical protein